MKDLKEKWIALKRKILRGYYKITPYQVYREYYCGKFRVRYKDGRESEPMNYKTAKSYAEIFGGKIIDNF